MHVISLGRLAIDADGRFAPKPADRPLEFTFGWRGRHCRAELSADGLMVETHAARIPSTAEGRDLRQSSFATLAALNPDLPQLWRMGLTPDHRVRFEADLALALPTNVPELIAALVRFVLALDPYLDRLEAAGAGWAVGSANT